MRKAVLFIGLLVFGLVSAFFVLRKQALSPQQLNSNSLKVTYSIGSGWDIKFNNPASFDLLLTERRIKEGAFDPLTKQIVPVQAVNIAIGNNWTSTNATIIRKDGENKPFVRGDYFVKDGTLYLKIDMDITLISDVDTLSFYLNQKLIELILSASQHVNDATSFKGNQLSYYVEKYLTQRDEKGKLQDRIDMYPFVIVSL